MSRCKYCGEPIKWEYDSDEASDGRSGYVPMDPDTGERHQCVVECKFCDEGIVWDDSSGVWIPVDPETGERHRCRS